jgi:hypothetical protein
MVQTHKARNIVERFTGHPRATVRKELRRAWRSTMPRGPRIHALEHNRKVT